MSAMRCIAMQSSYTEDVYTMSLVYYAYALYDSADLLTYKRNVLDRLRANAVTQGSIPSSTSVASVKVRSQPDCTSVQFCGCEHALKIKCTMSGARRG